MLRKARIDAAGALHHIIVGALSAERFFMQLKGIQWVMKICIPS